MPPAPAGRIEFNPHLGTWMGYAAPGGDAPLPFQMGGVLVQKSMPVMTNGTPRLLALSPGGDSTLLLPSAGIAAGTAFTIVNYSGSATITVNAANGATKLVLPAGAGIRVTAKMNDPLSPAEWGLVEDTWFNGYVLNAAIWVGGSGPVTPTRNLVTVAGLSSDLFGASASSLVFVNDHGTAAYLGGGAAKQVAFITEDYNASYESGTGAPLGDPGVTAAKAFRLSANSLNALGRRWAFQLLAKSTGNAVAAVRLHFGLHGASDDTVFGKFRVPARHVLKVRGKISYVSPSRYNGDIEVWDLTAGKVLGSGVLLDQQLNGHGTFSSDTFFSISQEPHPGAQLTIFSFDPEQRG